MTVGTTKELPVKVHLKTKVQQDEQADTFELALFGRYYEKGNAAFLKYDEVLEDGTIHTIVKLSDDNALILRSGALKMRLPFNRNGKKNGSYDSPYGTLLLSTDTKQLDHVREHAGELIKGTLTIEYDLWMQDNMAGNYQMVIHYKEVKEHS
ncbi:DUF1934 domain-containing protein [Heyndrickxia acidicola]|uniref:DUF1934 domain-containing protein n=1 Tax=Heyndrickxia acidicola TaxID=209389 RepID=A0ABU6MEL1_9BACI|nr:DUF1934 domain-containing protein [Heyndrickxia acidicola]MED1202884.1 DUF1934 domain-containing protein [Heyndrickxia acidicola]